MRCWANPEREADVDEASWLRCDQPQVMLEWLRAAGRASDRKSGHADASLVGHLRGPGPHYRGCHAIDALRGVACTL
jgi:hypothetical protein